MRTYSLLFVLAFAGPAAAQDPPRDPLKDLKLGDRVEINLKTGFSIQGKLIAIDPKVTELEKMQVITLDISWEYPELKGHVGVERIHIKSSRKLPVLTPDELAARDKARQEALKKMETEDTARRARMAEREMEIEKTRREAEKREKAEKMKGVGAELEAKAEMMKKGAELFAKFPPEGGWGPDRAKQIAQKTITNVPATPDEREFIANIALWLQYRSYLEEKKLKGKEEEAVEEPKKEPPPAPAPGPAPKEEAPTP